MYECDCDCRAAAEWEVEKRKKEGKVRVVRNMKSCMQHCRCLGESKRSGVGDVVSKELPKRYWDCVFRSTRLRSPQLPLSDDAAGTRVDAGEQAAECRSVLSTMVESGAKGECT